MTIKNKIFIILVIGVLIRVFLIAQYKTYLNPHLWEYEEIANNLINGKGFLYHHLGNVPYRSYNNLLYSFLCAGIYLLTNHSYLAVLTVQALFFILLTYVIFCIGKILFNEKTGLFSAMLLVFHPGFIYYDVFNLMPLSMDAFFIALTVLLFLKFKNDLNILNMFLIGSVIGFGTLSRGIIGAILPSLVVYIILFLRTINLKYRIRMILILILSTLIIIMPWLVRNYIVHKKFVFITTFTGEALWSGNNIYASGTCLSRDGVKIFDLWPEDFRDKVNSLDESGQSKFFKKEALRFIRNNPDKFIKLYFKKLYYFWWFSPQSGILYPKSYFVIYKYFYIILLFFSILGIIFAFFTNGDQRKKNILVIIFVVMAISCSQSLFYSEGRHRWLIEPLIMIFSAYGFLQGYNILKKYCPKNRRRDEDY